MLLSIALISCGSDDDNGEAGSGENQEAFPPNVVRDTDIEAQEAGSPGQALLEWWQSYQFADANQVIDRTSRETIDELGKKNLTELVKTRGQGLQGVEVLGTSESGNSATVRVGLLTFTPEEEGDPPPDEPTASKPATFTMEEEDGKWLFAEAAYLTPMIEGLKQAERQSEKEEGEK